jgi:nitrilase
VRLLNSPFRVSVVQAAPVFLDREATLDKACELILEAGGNGARLVVFPESFIPSYPIWSSVVPADRKLMLNDLYAEFLANAVTIPGDALDKICRIARRAKTCVVVGISERNIEASGASLYSTLVYIDEQGQILGKHRKLVIGAGEHLMWAQGDGDTLDVHNTLLGKLGGLVNQENYMPLARYALYAWGAQIYVVATCDSGETWFSTLRHIAKEGGIFVLSAGSVLRTKDIPDRYAFKQEFFSNTDEWFHVGGSAIVGPDGKVIAGPLHRKEEILYAEIDPRQLGGPKWMFDVAGQDARPDIFQLSVNREARTLVTQASASQSSEWLETPRDSSMGI